MKKCVQNSIDRLPDEVLISIVSRLPVVEAVRTSVLARRWRHFWMFNSVLNFDATRVVCKLFEQKTGLEIERTRFTNWVNRIVNLHSGATIDEFRILFDLDGDFANNIDQWIVFAFAKRVKRLELILVQTYAGVQHGRYSFPNICHLPLGLASIESLVMLSLTEVDVTGDVVEFFISNCPFLEELCVKDSGRLKSLRTTRPSMQLRHLTIVNCRGFRSLEICSPNLLSFTFCGTRISMSLKNVSSLVSLSLEAVVPATLAENSIQITKCLSRLETLILRTSSLLEYEVLPKFPDLPRLKKLVLEVCASGQESLLCFTPLINAAPLLCEIVVKPNWRHSDDPLIPRTIRLARGHSLDCLQVLQIVDFGGARIDLELAQYVLENAASLKKIIIDLHRPFGDVMGVDRMAMAREGVRLLKAKLREGVELIVR